MSGKDNTRKMNIFEIAEYLFGPMRSSTEEEIKLEHEMIMRDSKPVGINVFDMIEQGKLVDGKEIEDEDQGLLS